jgi:hypothetical protein
LGVGASDYWYETINDVSLRQGDIFRGVKAVQLPQDLVVGDNGANAGQVTFEVVTEDWIILDASCDVDYGPNRAANCQQVLLAAVRSATKQALKTDTDKEFNTRLEVMRRGHMAGRFLLPGHDALQPAFPLSFVQYNARVLLPHAYLLSQCIVPRIRLKSPHRESFGSWAASCIGRVGIEDAAQIPKFVGQLYPGQVIAADGGN